MFVLFFAYLRKISEARTCAYKNYLVMHTSAKSSNTINVRTESICIIVIRMQGFLRTYAETLKLEIVRIHAKPRNVKLIGLQYISLNRLMRKPTICICENKGADQRLCFRYTDSTLLSKSKISRL